MRAGTAFVCGTVIGAAACRMALSLSPRQRTTFESPDGVPQAGTRAFEEELAALTHSGSEGGNSLRLFDGRENYLEELLDVVQRAEESIWMEIFWWREGRFAQQMARVLKDALARGVHVRLIVDGFGSHNAEAKSLTELRRAGADIQVFSPLSTFSVRRLNKRTHRRILVVDQEVAYTGGVGIDDRWLGNEDDLPWADVLLRIRGPGVRRLAGIFADHWRIITGDPLAGARALRRHETAGDAYVQVLHSGPESGAAGMRLALLYALESAREKVRIVTPYFIPDQLMIERLIACRRRGAEVELILPSRKIDHPVVRRASRTTWGPLLEAGVRIMEHQPTLVHTKALLIDDAWCLIGSMNVDERSFRLNAEVAVGTSDPGVIRTLSNGMDRYCAEAVRIGLEDWRDRPLPTQAVDQVAGILGAQL